MDDECASWRELISEKMQAQGESWDDVVSCTATDAELDERFYQGFGATDGVPFTLWTKRRVYFPVEYDGAESVASVSRDPDGKPTPHVGWG